MIILSHAYKGKTKERQGGKLKEKKDEKETEKKKKEDGVEDEDEHPIPCQIGAYPLHILGQQWLQ